MGSTSGPGPVWHQSVTARVVAVAVLLTGGALAMAIATGYMMGQLREDFAWVRAAERWRGRALGVLDLSSQAREGGGAASPMLGRLHAEAMDLERALQALREGDPEAGYGPVTLAGLPATLDGLRAAWRTVVAPALVTAAHASPGNGGPDAVAEARRQMTALLAGLDGAVRVSATRAEDRLRLFDRLQSGGTLAALFGFALVAWWARALYRRERGAAREAAHVARMRAILGSTADAIVVAGPDGRIEEWNAAAERLFGWSAADACGRPVTTLLPVLPAPPPGPAVEQAVEARRADGKTFPADVAVASAPLGDGRATVYAIHDASERESLARSRAEQAALVRLGEMAAIVAHEVRNPLAGISAAAQILGARFPADDPAREVASEVRARIAGLNAFVGDILSYARPRPLSRCPHSLRGIVHAATGALARDPAWAGVVVACEGEDRAILADGEQLAQALFNLLQNAAQAMEGRGTITVTLGEADGAATVTVADRGPGIAPGNRAKLFEAFFTTKVRGSGLGLVVVKRIAEMHGATARIECPPTGGTRVTLARLPLVTVGATARVPAA